MPTLSRIGIVLSFLATASPALADCIYSVRRCDNVLITRLVTDQAGTVSVMTSGTETFLNCASVENTYLLLKMNEPNAAAVYSHLLSAHLNQKTATIRLSDTDPVCTITYLYTDS